jgi:hypothetical protein
MCSPPGRARASLERTNDLLGDPPAVEVTILEGHLLAVDLAGVHVTRVRPHFAAKVGPKTGLTFSLKFGPERVAVVVGADILAVGMVCGNDARVAEGRPGWASFQRLNRTVENGGAPSAGRGIHSARGPREWS